MTRPSHAQRCLSLLCTLLACAIASAQSPAPPASAAAPPASGSSAGAAPAASATAGGAKLYTVVDGYKVDHNTMDGFRAWRAAACDRCHGANQQGLVGPSLIESLKTLSKEDFVKIVRDGRLEKGMMSFATSKTVMDNVDNLYAYLKGRSNGDITRAKVEELKP